MGDPVTGGDFAAITGPGQVRPPGHIGTGYLHLFNLFYLAPAVLDFSKHHPVGTADVPRPRKVCSSHHVTLSGAILGFTEPGGLALIGTFDVELFPCFGDVQAHGSDLLVGGESLITVFRILGIIAAAGHKKNS